MPRTRLSAALVAAISLAGCLSAANAQAQVPTQAAIPAGLFSNYYVGPPGLPAKMYVCPRPTPPFVGHTWYTYPPFAPHEYLYAHKRVYTRLNPNGTSTTTRVVYSPFTWYR
jgi:hypothetical protein